jgi:hypothetical protein
MSLGITGEYCPSYDRPWIAGNAWNGYLRDRLVAIARETEAEVVLFDGVAPYPGIGQATQLLRDVSFIWLRRGLWKDGVGAKHLRRSSFFDLVVEPGDLARTGDDITDSETGNARTVAPVSLIEVIETLSREEARRELGLPSDATVALVTLGSGRLGDVAGPGGIAIETLLEGSNAHVAITRSAVAVNQIAAGASNRVTELAGVFPLVRYLRAFDLAVSSTGYNAVHELIPAGIPTLFVANTSTRTDDQVARGRLVARAGLALNATDDDPDEIAEGVRSLIDPQARADLGSSAGATRAKMTGASEIARLASIIGQTFSGRRQSASAMIRGGIDQAKEAVKTSLGEERTEQLKRMLGREPSPVGHRTAVHLVDEPEEPSGETLPLAILENIDQADLKRSSPVEHLLPNSSAAYRNRRLEIIDHYYDVVD